MPLFNYQARTRQGAFQSGRVEASTTQAAQEILQNNDLLVVALEAVEEAPLFGRNIKLFGGVKSVDIIAFARQFATLFEAGVPMVMGLRTLAADWDNPAMREVLSAVAADVDGGTPFSKALEKHPDAFSNFYVQMIRGGEASGKLGEILEFLADYEDRTYHFKKKLTGAMTYPAFVLVVFFIIAALMLVFVVPQLTALLQQTGQELPFATNVLIFSSALIRDFWYLLILGGVFGGFGLGWLIRTPEGRALWDPFLIHVPVVGSVVKKMYVYRFAESLYLLVQGGVPIVQALSITADTMGHTSYVRIVKEVEEHVRRGGTMASVLRLHDEFPGLITQMVNVGEQTGKLDAVLKSVAVFYEKEIYASLDSITGLIQPILLTFIALGVALLVTGILMPIYQISTSVAG